MALKAIMLRKKIDDTKTELAELEKRSAGFEAREAELEKAIEEASSDEEKQAVEESVEKFDEEKNDVLTKISEVKEMLEKLEAELADEEKKQEESSEKEDEAKQTNTQRGDTAMIARKSFSAMTRAERTQLFANEEVRTFVNDVRTAGKAKRAVTGAELTIPEIILELVYSDVEKYSKLYDFVNVKKVKGTARQNVLGDIPEGIWTEMGAAVNEVALTFTSIEVDGYKVGAYIPIENYLLEDSDIALGSEIINALSRGLGLALDKAILYGSKTGKMPTGIMSSLDAANILSIASTETGIDLFRSIVESAAALKHGSGAKFWVMNPATHMKLLAASAGANSAAAIVAGMNEQMPVISGTIIELDFIPDNTIIGGYGDRYLLAERAGIKVVSSTEYKFVEDLTVFKATARYDGTPIFADAFIAVGIEGTTPDPSAVTFAQPKAEA